MIINGFDPLEIDKKYTLEIYHIADKKYYKLTFIVERTSSFTEYMNYLKEVNEEQFFNPDALNGPYFYKILTD